MTGALGYGIVNVGNGLLNPGFIVAAAIVAAFVYHIHKFNRPPS
jgi:hypothetical protein